MPPQNSNTETNTPTHHYPPQTASSTYLVLPVNVPIVGPIAPTGSGMAPLFLSFHDCFLAVFRVPFFRYMVGLANGPGEREEKEEREQRENRERTERTDREQIENRENRQRTERTSKKIRTLDCIQYLYVHRARLTTRTHQCRSTIDNCS